ncbi:MAG: hypothetical protein Q8K29_07075 [Polaromonas sp.]|nr:hypothetical protein [Polaromonas sp.]
MIYDDDDLKVRRNLLVFSALIILAEWFNLRLGQMAAKALRLDAELDPLKLCVAALAILAYLALRYKDAVLFGAKKYSEAVDDDLARITPTVITHYAQFMANLYTWTGYQAPIFVGGIGKHTADKAEGMGEAVAKARRPRIHLTLSDVRASERSQASDESPKSDAYLTMSTTVIWTAGSSSGGYGLFVQSVGVHQTLIWLYSRIWWFFYCEAAVKARLPILLGLIASGILLMKIVAILPHR